MEAGGDDGGVVAEEGVARSKVFRQVAEVPVGDGAQVAVHDEQARLVAALRRLLGDQALRQRVVEEVGGEGHDAKAVQPLMVANRH